MVDLSRLFDEAGKRFTAELASNIRRQTDINGDRFSPVARSTAMARQRQKGLGRGLSVRMQTQKKLYRGRVLAVNVQRLMNTNKFFTGAFKYSFGQQFLTVSANPSGYDSKVSYADIVRYNNQGSPNVNRNIVRPPLIFPNSDADIEKIKAFGQMVRKFNSPEVKQEILRMAAGGVTQSVKVDMKL